MTKRLITIFLSLVLILISFPTVLSANAEETVIEETDENGFKFQWSEEGNYYILTGIPAGQESITVPARYNWKTVSEIGSYQEPFRVGYNCMKTLKFSENNYRIDSFYLKQGALVLEYNEYENGKYLGTEDNPYYVLMDVIDKTVTEFTLHEDTEVIADYAFLYVRDLTKITLSPVLKYAAPRAFICDMLVNEHGADLEYNEYGGCLYLGTDVNPYHMLIKMKNADVKSIVVHKDTKVISPSAFRYYVMDGTSDDTNELKFAENLESITIPESVISIGSYAFYGCSSLKEINFESSHIDIFEREGLPENVNLNWDYSNESAEETDENGYVFQLSEDGSHYILVRTPANQETIVIPAEFNGKPVCAISDIDQPFITSSSTVKNIYFSDNILKVHAWSFGTLKYLERNEYENGMYLGTEDNPYYALMYLIDTEVTEFTMHEDTEIIAGYAFYPAENLKKITVSDSLKYVSHENFCFQIWQMPYYMELDFNEYKNGLYIGSATNPYHILVRLKDADVETFEIHEDTKMILSASISVHEEDVPTDYIIKESAKNSITIPKSVVSIKEGAFDGFISLHEINFKAKNEEQFKVLELDGLPEYVNLNWNYGNEDDSNESSVPDVSSAETSSEDSVNTSEDSPDTAESENNSIVWIITGVVILAVLITATVVIKNKKNA